MIQLKNLTPHVYSDQSRDFQFIERLFDVVLNSVKTGCDNLYSLPFSDDSDRQLTTLLSLTLGFKSKHHYNAAQLASLCTAMCEIMKLKGTLHAIDLLCKTMLNSEGIADEAFISRSDSDPYAIDIYLPQTLSDASLLKDALDYVLPAGVSCRIIKELHLAKSAETRLTTNDDVAVYDNSGSVWSSGDFEDAFDKTTSVVATANNLGSLKASIAAGTNLKGTPGAIGNMTVVQPTAAEK